MVDSTPGARSVPAALADLLARHQADSPASAQRFVVGYSGGLDSSVLLHALVGQLGPDRVIAVHVHHGLQAQADAWLDHCRAGATALGCRFESAALARGQGQTPDGLEAWAREGRRRVLFEACRQAGQAAVLLAHHADDQVETLLLNWGRGSGPVGMAGMRLRSRQQGVWLLRPLLNLPRTCLADYAQAQGIVFVEDPSNHSLLMRRNRVRHELLPIMDDIFPGFRGNVLRAAGLTRQWLDTVEADPAVPGRSFDRRVWSSLAAPEIDQQLHRWLTTHGLRPASAARTRHLREQLVHGNAAYAEVAHDGCLLRRYRDRISLASAALEPVASQPTPLDWQGESQFRVPGWPGRWSIGPARAGEAGLPEQVLHCADLMVVPLRASAAIRVRSDGPHRRLKQLCQEAGIPAWRRRRLPMLQQGDEVLFVAGLGLNRSFTMQAGPTGQDSQGRRCPTLLTVHYEPDDPA